MEQAPVRRSSKRKNIDKEKKIRVKPARKYSGGKKKKGRVKRLVLKTLETRQRGGKEAEKRGKTSEKVSSQNSLYTVVVPRKIGKNDKWDLKKISGISRSPKEGGG